MSTPENSFIRGVHRYVTAYFEKTNNPYRGGTPDCYYEDTGMLWIEYKFIVVPKREDTPVLANLSELQKSWLRRCHDKTGRARVVIGCKAGGALLQSPGEWEEPMPARRFKQLVLSRPALGAAISALCQTSSICLRPHVS